MSIPSNKVLDKMSELVTKAKTAENEAKRQGYIIAIKTLCDLLEQEEIVPEASFVQKSDTIEDYTSKQPLQLDDANGSSLLDF